MAVSVDSEEVLKGGLTFFSQCFHSFSATWNLKVDVSKEGDVSVYLVERGFVRPLRPDQNEVVLYQTENQNMQATSIREIVDNGQNCTYPLNFKSVFFSVSVCDSKLSKEFKLFFSFAKDQKQVIGCENFFSMSQLGNQSILNFKVRVSEEILHSAAMHLLADNFDQIIAKEEKDDPDMEQKVPY